MSRVLGLADLVGIGIGHVIGAGVFVLSGVAIQPKAGPAAFLSYLIAGLAAILTALSYCELASRFPYAGSAFTFAYIALGEMPAFAIGWDLSLEYLGIEPLQVVVYFR